MIKKYLLGGRLDMLLSGLIVCDPLRILTHGQEYMDRRRE